MERHQVGSAPASMSGQEEQLEQQPPLYDAHNDAQMSPAAVDQLQAAAAAAQAGEYAPDEDMKHHGLPTDEDTYAVEEAARAAAYAVTKSLEEEQRMDGESAHLWVPASVNFSTNKNFETKLMLPRLITLLCLNNVGECFWFREHLIWV